MGNLRVALRTALDEGARYQAESRLKVMQGSGMLKEGVAPSVFGAAIGLAQQGLNSAKEAISGDIITGYTEEQRMAQTRKQTALSTINSMIDNGVFADTPAAALLALEKSAGLSEGTALAWQSKIKDLQKKNDARSQLELRRLQLDIKESEKRLSESDGGGTTVNVNDILQDGIDNGRTAAQVARDAVTVYENLGIQVTPTMLNRWTEIAKGLKKTEAPVDSSSKEVPFTKSYGKGGFTKIPLSTQLEKIRSDYAKIGFPNATSLIREELIKKGYNTKDVYEATKTMGESILSNTSSFFSNLFK